MFLTASLQIKIFKYIVRSHLVQFLEARSNIICVASIEVGEGA